MSSSSYATLGRQWETSHAGQPEPVPALNNLYSDADPNLALALTQGLHLSLTLTLTLTPTLIGPRPQPCSKSQHIPEPQVPNQAAQYASRREDDWHHGVDGPRGPLSACRRVRELPQTAFPTPIVCSPEPWSEPQLNYGGVQQVMFGGIYTSASEVFSTAVVVWECLSQRPLAALQMALR